MKRGNSKIEELPFQGGSQLAQQKGAHGKIAGLDRFDVAAGQKTAEDHGDVDKNAGKIEADIDSVGENHERFQEDEERDFDHDPLGPGKARRVHADVKNGGQPVRQGVIEAWRMV